MGSLPYREPPKVRANYLRFVANVLMNEGARLANCGEWDIAHDRIFPLARELRERADMLDAPTYDFPDYEISG